jgi:beta-glucanase (GH16 family)
VAWAGGTPPDKRDTWNTKLMPLSSFPKEWAENFHTWRMDWDEDSIKLYLDGVQVNSQDLSKTINAPAQDGVGGSGGQAPENPFHAPLYILLNQAIGGMQGGDPTATEFPVLFVVDYVRVWQTPSQREKATTRNGATEAPAINASSSAPPARQPRGRTTAINVVELSVINGKLVAGDPNQPTYIDLKPVREDEK